MSSGGSASGDISWTILGIDGFETDGGEMAWGKDLVFADGTDGRLNRNRYPRDYTPPTTGWRSRMAASASPAPATPGRKLFPRTGPATNARPGMPFKRSLLAGLSAGMSGVIFWGRTSPASRGRAERGALSAGCADGLLLPITQYHAESKAELNQDRTPWNIADRSGDPRADGLAFYANVRMQLLPYLEREAAHCVVTKTPLMRAMLLDHQDDPQAIGLWDQ